MVWYGTVADLLVSTTPTSPTWRQAAARRPGSMAITRAPNMPMVMWLVMMKIVMRVVVMRWW